MKKTVRLFSLAVALVLVLSLTACGQSQNSNAPSSTPSSTQDTPSAPAESGNSNETVTADLDWLKGQNITIVVPFKAGGSLDLMVRAFIPFWEAEAGCTFIVDNREGASSQVGATYFTTTKPDMTTIFCATQTYFSGNIILNGATYGLDDFTLFNMQQVDPTTLTVLQSSPYDTVEDLVKAIQEHPGELKCGTVAGSAGTIMLSILEEKYGKLDFKMVTYDSGNDFRTALLGGHVDFIPGSANGDMGLGDEAKVLVVCGSERNKIWPDTPCTDEVWPELNIPGSLGSCRFYAANSAAVEAYPERFQALLETYEKAFNNPEYQKILEDSGELYVSAFYGPEESTELNNSLHALIEQYKDVFAG